MPCLVEDCTQYNVGQHIFILATLQNIAQARQIESVEAELTKELAELQSQLATLQKQRVCANRRTVMDVDDVT